MWVLSRDAVIETVSEWLRDLSVVDLPEVLGVYVPVVAIGDPRDGFALRHALFVLPSIAKVASFNAGEVLVQWGTRLTPILTLVPHEAAFVGAVDGSFRLYSKSSFDASPQASVRSMSTGNEGREDESFHHCEV